MKTDYFLWGIVAVSFACVIGLIVLIPPQPKDAVIVAVCGRGHVVVRSNDGKYFLDWNTNSPVEFSDKVCR